ncbi:zinc finger BED domain-containing protein RICESLEEPER 3-like [Ricinus communis]|uniref:zinc finger BED domain-containing protein RICESLEEPER 3-like n=1 Tax=Ricinus communis TaxID=3988 RepID=UPI00201A7510|nr:zinc finger BED domain-containing protein RICESLEEPER 3-like [Ricinus communis]XP_048235097.1 zinc finger BED domain-containing protein RICESLEEPER 3-like [Ricinus communis]XP_048235098.1 zinc finger BED domain-containing protein RICESLEEPER 3-like [Ricinus communis]XP_048235099.1 zinc finger BED domain-containing protein RICESLEEPER 3-like [Ricinus communis]XP_048235100.1 zinc finger BED domain-containing protein RICESLEEPER 3-like [Ricinus communis]XP_048235101.1 zinc finger BED domain-co
MLCLLLSNGRRLKLFVNLLESIYDVANVFFEAKHSTANIYLYHLCELMAILIQASSSLDDFIRYVAEEILKKFDQYWKDVFLVLAIAIMLDPRFQMKYIEFARSKSEGSKGNLQIESIMVAFHSLCDSYATLFPQSDDSDSDVTDLEKIWSLSQMNKSQNSIDSFIVLQDYHQFIQSSSQLPKSDPEWYLEEPVLSWRQDFRVLGWWKAATAKCHTLPRMAHDFLAIPISEATSFEAFYLLLFASLVCSMLQY